MENNIYLTSKEDLQSEFSKNIRKRSLEQKFFYTKAEDIKNYYKYINSLKSKKTDLATTILSQEDYYNFLKKQLNKRWNISLISLGCGNAEIEKYALSKLTNEGYKICYTGVDVSSEMIKIAKQNLKDININKKFICVDITSDLFRSEIGKLSKNCQLKIFSFLGSTLGNVNQTDIADTLFNILSKNDLLWLDVPIRPDLSNESDLKIFKRYMSRLSDKNVTPFYFCPLKNINVPFSSGKLGLRMTREESVGSLLFRFYFTFEKKVVIEYNNEKIHFLPTEEIQLINIRTYHPKTLIHFFKEHEFKLADSLIVGNKAQFMFKKLK